MRKYLLLSLIPLATACTSMAPPPTAPVTCSPESLARYNGQVANDALAARMKRETGKTVIRWVRPGMAVTMDFREDRLTVYLNDANRVERTSCT